MKVFFLWTLVLLQFPALVYLVEKSRNDIIWSSVVKIEEKKKVIEPVSKQQAIEIADHKWTVDQVLVRDPGHVCTGFDPLCHTRLSYSEIVLSSLPVNGEPMYWRTIRIQRTGKPSFDKLKYGMTVEFEATFNTCQDPTNFNVVCYLGVKKVEELRHDIIGKWNIEGGQ